MTDYIRREDALKALYNDYAYSAMDVIKRLPAADVAEVVHGRWTFETATVNTLSRTKCNICGWWTLDPSVDGAYEYCPNCGAKMNGDVDYDANRNA